jgi:alkylation response protein AidB-like acyl-CoA dehydrogenase
MPFLYLPRPLHLETIMSYTAPLKDMLFDIEHLANIAQVSQMPGLEDAGLETAQAVLEECARFNQDVIAPLNVAGDRDPSSFKDGQVTTTPGFKEAFAQYVAGGWQGLQHPADFGGQGLPKTIGAACGEMLNSANMSFALCPLLSDGAIEALLTAGSDELKATYLEKLVSGQWTGTMNLTEPQAGSDLSLVRSRAEPRGDGTYKVFGTKIFITYGEHDMAENIVHLVLARVTGAPEGVKGISLFVVPKFLVNKDGSLGARNDVHCVSIEHKLGIKASPTAVLQYGDGMVASIADSAGPGAVGYLVGQENRGLEYMFIMMNSARYAVGMQGIAIAERAYQHAVAYAKDRVQSRPVDGSMNASAPIIHHPDVKRMLMTMRAYTEGCRAMASVAAAAYDAAHHHPDADTRKQNQAFYEFMVPLVKGYSTEMSLEVASLGVQVHGGMGFIEETGAAQYLRDAKILTIYEGTTAIQANDFVGRKTARDGGQTAKAIAAQIEATEAELAKRDGAAARAVHKQLAAARKAFVEVVEFVAGQTKAGPKSANAVFAGSVPYLMLAGNVVAGWQLARSLLVAEELAKAGTDTVFMNAKIATARFYAEHILNKAPGIRDSIIDGAESVTALAIEAF